MQFTFNQMLEKLNASSQSEWKESKLRYYLLKILDEKVGTRGQKASYPAQTLGKLLFLAGVTESPMQPSLKQAVQLMGNLDEEELTRIGEGKEQIEIGIPDLDETGTPIYRTLSGQTAPQDNHSFGRVMSLTENQQLLSNSSHAMEEFAAPSSLEAADYVASEFTKHLSVSESAGRQLEPAWQTINFGSDLQIRYRKTLAPGQKKQLKLAGELLRSVLSEEK